MNLVDLSDEVWTSVGAYLVDSALLKLCFTGNSAIGLRIRRSVRCAALTWKSTTFLDVNAMFRSALVLPRLESISIEAKYSFQACLWPLNLSLLPKSLRSLDFRFQSCFEAVLFHPQLFEILPNLESLSLRSSSVSLHIPGVMPLANIPRSVRFLRLCSSSHSVKTLHLAHLPGNLEFLELECAFVGHPDFGPDLTQLLRPLPLKGLSIIARNLEPIDVPIVDLTGFPPTLTKLSLSDNFEVYAPHHDSERRLQRRNRLMTPQESSHEDINASSASIGPLTKYPSLHSLEFACKDRSYWDTPCASMKSINLAMFLRIDLVESHMATEIIGCDRFELNDISLFSHITRLITPTLEIKDDTLLPPTLTWMSVGMLNNLDVLPEALSFLKCSKLAFRDGIPATHVKRNQFPNTLVTLTVANATVHEMYLRYFPPSLTFLSANFLTKVAWQTLSSKRMEADSDESLLPALQTLKCPKSYPLSCGSLPGTLTSLEIVVNRSLEVDLGSLVNLQILCVLGRHLSLDQLLQLPPKLENLLLEANTSIISAAAAKGLPRCLKVLNIRTFNFGQSPSIELSMASSLPQSLIFLNCSSFGSSVHSDISKDDPIVERFVQALPPHISTLTYDKAVETLYYQRRTVIAGNQAATRRVHEGLEAFDQ